MTAFIEYLTPRILVRWQAHAVDAQTDAPLLLLLAHATILMHALGATGKAERAKGRGPSKKLGWITLP